jgi:CRP/FNR family transcriptional regulator
MDDHNDHAYNLLRYHPWFEDLSPDALKFLISASRRRIHTAGSTIYRQGEPGTTCHIIIEGRVRVFVVTQDGRELTFRIMGPGEMMGEMALFEDLPRSASIVAVSETHTLELDEEILLRALRRSPGLALGMLRALSAKLRTTTEDAENLASLSVAERLYQRLKRLAAWSGYRVEDGVRIVPPLTQQELATLVGTTRESVNRALVRLRAQSKLRWEDGWITLLDD